MPQGNLSLSEARENKKDEFYTQLSDIEKELKYYQHHFLNKVVYCNCDDPRSSQFFHYFSYNFEKLGLKKLITSCYKNQDIDLFSQHNSIKSIYLEYEGDKNKNKVPDLEEIQIKEFKGNGDFRNQENIEILKSCDIVVTNPPFSLFREYISQLEEYKKKYLVIGNINATSYKEIFRLIRDNKIWLGPSIRSGDREFGVPDDYPLKAASSRTDSKGKKYIRIKGVRWFTNMDYKERYNDIILYKKYNPFEYPSYDNHNAIEVNKTKDIPIDYDGMMGVPLTFLDKYNPEQFQIIGTTQSWDGLASKVYPTQIQVNSSGQRSRVKKLNDGAAIKVELPPSNKTFYIVDNQYYIKCYARILVKKMK
ncbi:MULTISPECIES: adenine-specific methyltransferase EcoRI family protein [unclassified Prochlorococcus]|uniref:adenine-specific methyltransferase EcoRI family protein n=1 Tax=unclassified Prochlorococcus TaxID=2627481 RepID=UPI0005339D43|nr:MULTISPECIES: adenine-specific methyltransferase EcoRI family protein [unclassified Prochlorococcus]KGG14708.1 methyltransferase (ssoIM) [Prochlorococcus sp. MIT 0602]KGG15862.1 methyltransferase (ssoIM) [Prochlorococcus sp. MIT 0603]